MATSRSGNDSEKEPEPKKLYDLLFEADGDTEFELVPQTFSVAGGARRQRASMTMERTGWARSNVKAGADLTKWLQDRRFDPVKVFLVTGVNKKKGLVAAYPVLSQVEGAMPLKWSTDGKTFSYHFGAALEQAPALRPVTRVEALVDFGKDSQGRECVIVNLSGALPKRKGAADAEEMAAREAEKAAQAAAKRAAIQARKRSAAARKGEEQPPEGGPAK